MTHRISIIVAMGANFAIGNKGAIPWRIPKDMERFKTITMGHPVIMGRKTWESIPKKFRPLPGRTNIVITRNQNYVAEGAHVALSLEAALDAAIQAPGNEEIFIAGGGEIYEEALPITNRMYLTMVNASPEADVFFPDYVEFDNEIEFVEHLEETPSYTFTTLERKVRTTR